MAETVTKAARTLQAKPEVYREAFESAVREQVEAIKARILAELEQKQSIKGDISS